MDKEEVLGVTEDTTEPNVFVQPSEADLELLGTMTPLAHQFLHAVRFLLDQRNEDDEPATAEQVVYYALTIASLTAKNCQGITESQLSSVVEKVNSQCQQMAGLYDFPTPIGRA